MSTDKQIDFAAILANSVHDMKNSLALLLGTLEQLGQGCGRTCPLGTHVEQMQHHGYRLNADLVRLLTIYKIERGEYAPNVREVDVGDLLQECVEMYRPLLQARGIAITADTEPELAGYFDREMVAGIINNAVNNACRYASTRITLRGAMLGDYVEIAVEDDGPGYPQYLLDGAESDQRATDYRRGTTSLGLYFAALIAELHENRGRRGRIRYGNDGGARFSLLLP